MINRKEELNNIGKLEKLLDERLGIEIDTDNRMGNEGDSFLSDNPDWIYYKGILKTLETLGYEWSREEYKHTVYER